MESSWIFPLNSAHSPEEEEQTPFHWLALVCVICRQSMEEIQLLPSPHGPSFSSSTDKAPLGLKDTKNLGGRSMSFEKSAGCDDVEMGNSSDDHHITGQNSGSMKSRASSKKREVEAALVWKELTITMRGKRTYSDKVVNSCTGYALPGTLTVIMGPPKSGKTTLLRALAGLLPSTAEVYGQVLVNGRRSQLEYGTYGYVGRADELFETLTVREVLYHSALLQLPDSMPRSKKAVLAENATLAMSLEECADTRIGGNCYCKGLASGERRRVSIARELITSPPLLFIDEPLYHLDCVSALLIMVMLKKLASTGCTVIFTMYHSSTEVFGLFDRICLLANGKTLFFGENLACLQHFANAGFPCPVMQSPSDHFLRAINTDFDRITTICKNLQDDKRDFSSVNMDTAIAIQTLEITYKASDDADAVEAMLSKLTKEEGLMVKSKGHANAYTHVLILTWRSFLNIARDFRFFWLRLVLYMVFLICTGSVFSNLGHSLSSARARAAAIFPFIAFTSLLTIGGFPSHIKEIKVYKHEKAARHTGAIVFLLGNFLSTIPFLFLISISCSAIIYFLLGLRSDFSLFMYFGINFFLCLLINDGLLMVLASISPKVFKGIMTMVLLQGIMMLVAGYFRLRDELPRPIWKYPLSYLAFHTYAIEGLLENEYTGVSFPVGQVTSISGEQAIHDSYNISSSRNMKWLNLLILAVIAVGYRFILFISLRAAERHKF